jgi:hypothetical protein
MAAKGAHMKSNDPNPPRWADAMLRSLLRPADRDSTSGDLLEEYRVAKRPSLGRIRANVWYFGHVLSVLWHLIQPCALLLIGVNVLRVLLGVSREWFFGTTGPTTAIAFVARSLWYGSVVQAPGLSLPDALIYLWAGYYGFRKTRLLRTGMIAAGAVSFIGFTILFSSLAITTPTLLLAAFSKPFIFVILATFSLMDLGYGAVVGAIGAIVAKWITPPDAPQRAHVS